MRQYSTHLRKFKCTCALISQLPLRLQTNMISHEKENITAFRSKLYAAYYDRIPYCAYYHHHTFAGQ